MWKRLAMCAILCTVCFPLAAQHDRGSSGSARGQNERRQDQALNRNFDPRFVPFKRLIHDRLKKQVGQVALSYDSVKPTNTHISPDEFLATEVVAKRVNIPASALLSSIAENRKNLHTEQFLALENLSGEERRNQFSQELTTALSQHGVSSANAKAAAEDAVRTVHNSQASP